MKHRTIVLALISLLFLSAAGFDGCGKTQKLSSIIVTPADPVIATNTALQLSVRANFTGGMSLPSWTQVTWESSIPQVATVTGSGLVTAVEAGTAVITATDIANPSIAASVTVWIVALTGIDISPAIISIPVGTNQPFTAAGVYLDGTPPGPADLTPHVFWVSSSPDIALISNVTGSQGFAAAVSAGTTTITATVPATSATGTVITGTATLTVVP